MPRLLYLQERDPVPILQEAGWTPELVETGAQNLALPLGFNPCTIRPAARRYTDYVVLAHHQTLSTIIIIIIYLSWSWATCWPVPVSRIQKSLQRSAMIPSASWGIVFHYPITRHSMRGDPKMRIFFLNRIFLWTFPKFNHPQNTLLDNQYTYPTAFSVVQNSSGTLAKW